MAKGVLKLWWVPRQHPLEGDILTSCVAEPDTERPSAFEAPPGSGYTLRVFRCVRA
jgi:hypothetical protein